MKTQSALFDRPVKTDDNFAFSATPALADRRLFLRSNRTLYCIDAMQTAGAGK
jgi:hypothetical protein